MQHNRYEFVSLVLLRENDPFYTSPRRSKKGGGGSFVPKEVQKGDLPYMPLWSEQVSHRGRLQDLYK